VDRGDDIGLVVYGYNEITGNISGELYEKWSEREKWCLEKLTLNGHLPLDVIDINVTTKTFCLVNGKGRKDAIVEITGSRYYKINPDSSIKFPTRLVSNKGVYSHNTSSVEGNDTILANAGFVEHKNCIPYLAHSKANVNSKTNAEFRKADCLEIVVVRRNEKNKIDESNKVMLCDIAARMEEFRRPLLDELQIAETRIKNLGEISKLFKTARSASLRDFPQGVYKVVAAKKQATRFGDTFKLLLDVEGENKVVWSNKYIKQTIDSLPSGFVQEIENNGFLFVCNKDLAKLTVTGRGTNHYGHVIVYCKFEVYQNVHENTGEKSTTLEETTILTDNTVVMQILEKEDLLAYREYDSLATLPVGSTHKLSAFGMAKSYGTTRLVIKLDERFYQAGENVEENITLLKPEGIIKIEKIRTNPSKHAKYAVCSIYEPGDWTAHVNYLKTPMLTIQDGSTCIVDVKSVDVKGVKRKLLLTDNGTVYKLKKSKLEDCVQPGFL
jgi:hypothetical protein